MLGAGQKILWVWGVGGSVRARGFIEGQTLAKFMGGEDDFAHLV